MRIRKNILVLLSTIIVLGINYLLFTNRPVTETINVKDYLIGIDIIIITVILTIVEKIAEIILSKLFTKWNFSYKPKAFWLISLSFILFGLLIICIYLFEEYLPYYTLNNFIINIIFQFFILLITSALLYEIYNFISSFSIKFILLFIKLADKLFNMKQIQLALFIYNSLRKNILVIKNPAVYAKTKLGTSKCYYELSKTSSKRSNLQKAIKELEDITKIRELGKHLGIVKINLGDLHCEYYEIDSKTNHLTTSLSLYENAMKHFRKDEHAEIYRELTDKTSNVQSKLSALRGI